VIRTADREDSQNEPIDPPVDCPSPHDPTDHGSERRPPIFGPPEGGTPTPDPACGSPAFRRSPSGDGGPAEAGTPTPESGGPRGLTSDMLVRGSTARDLTEDAMDRCTSPREDTEPPQAEETADLPRPLLRTTIVPLTLALVLALLAGAVVRGGGEPQKTLLGEHHRRAHSREPVVRTGAASNLARPCSGSGQWLVASQTRLRSCHWPLVTGHSPKSRPNHAFTCLVTACRLARGGGVHRGHSTRRLLADDHLGSTDFRTPKALDSKAQGRAAHPGNAGSPRRPVFLPLRRTPTGFPIPPHRLGWGADCGTPLGYMR
jgi:hypothetical protein